MNDRTQCVILVPAGSGVEFVCDAALRQLERMGFPVWRVPGYAQIDLARCQMATDALAKGFEELFWIDSDMEFDPAAVDRLRAHNLPIVGGLYPKKGVRGLASSLLPETEKIIFGAGGGLLEIRYAATGFLHTRRQVYLDIRRHCSLPTCNEQFHRPLVPYFMPMSIETDDSPDAKPRHWYLPEDFAFCHRARVAGYKIFADATLRIGHVGRYVYGWEDAGASPPRYATLHLRLRDM